MQAMCSLSTIPPRATGQRLVSGQAGPDAICLWLEHGGRGYHHAILQFQLVGEHWTLAGRTNGLPLLYR
jgi:hypothetical protein